MWSPCPTWGAEVPLVRGGVLVAVLLALGGCRGDREPPLAAGEGVRIEDRATARVVSVDPTRTPVVGACPERAVIRSDGEGRWSCAELAAADLEQVRALSAQALAEGEAVAALAGEVAELTTRVEALEARAEVLARTPDLRASAYACAPREDAILSGRVFTTAGKQGFNQDAVGEIVLSCPVIATRGTPRWNTLELAYLDTDAGDAGGVISARLLAVAFDGAVEELATVGSAGSSETAHTRVSTRFLAPFDLTSRTYAVEVTLQRVDPAVRVSFAGYALVER